MIIEMFNFWYFFWLILCAGAFIGLYFLLRNRTKKTQKLVLFGILLIALVMHFTKVYYPPYSTDTARMLRDSWFVNICGANIALFPFFFISKSKIAKEYMFVIGIISSLIALFYPVEPIEKVDQLAEQLDIIRFYIHHFLLGAIPALMVMLGLHKVSYKRIFAIVPFFSLILGFIMLNQILQAELGFIPMRSQDFFDINYKNTSYIWEPDDGIGNFLATFCPEFFTKVPIGEYAGQTKYWPLFWLLVPAFVLITPLAFGLYMIFDRKAFVSDCKWLIAKIKALPSLVRARFGKNNELPCDEISDVSEDEAKQKVSLGDEK